MWIAISIVVLVFLICYGYYKTMLKWKQNDEFVLALKKKKAIFITGCDSGFGYSLILHNLSNLGPKNDRILIAGCYYPNGRSEGADSLMQHAKNLGKEDCFRIVQLDVTKDDSVVNAKYEVDRILDDTGSMLWAVVNNAATLVFADAVFQTSQLVRNQIDVNLYGVWSVSKTFVPHLVASRGRLVNIVSFCAECPLPTLALYSATKAGVLCLSEAMRMELTKFGVDVILFNPGIAQDTQIFAGQKENFQMMSKDVGKVYKGNGKVLDYFKACEELYDEYHEYHRTPLKKIENPGLYTEFEKILTDPKPCNEYVNSDLITRSFFGILRVLPRTWSDMARLALMRLPK